MSYLPNWDLFFVGNPLVANRRPYQRTVPRTVGLPSSSVPWLRAEMWASSHGCLCREQDASPDRSTKMSWPSSAVSANPAHFSKRSRCMCCYGLVSVVALQPVELKVEVEAHRAFAVAACLPLLQARLLVPKYPELGLIDGRRLLLARPETTPSCPET